MRSFAFPLLLALAAPATGQIVPTLDLGVAGGVNFASLDQAGGLDLENSTGYHVGLYADVGAGPLHVRTGAYYLRAGDIDGAGADGDAGTVHFVSVPFDLQVQTPTPVVQAYLLAGPEVRFPLDGLDTFDTKTANLVANVGVGVKGGVPLVGPSGFLEARYALDLDGFGDQRGDDIGVDVKAHLFLIRVGVGM